MRAEHGAAAGPHRRAAGARASPAGALLAPRLGATAGDHAAGFGRGRPAPAGGLLGAHALVHERAGEARAEGALVELHLLAGRSRAAGQEGASGIAAHLHDSAARPRDRAAHQQQVLLGVDATTSRPFWVTRLLPI